MTDPVTGGTHTCKAAQGTVTVQSARNAGRSSGVVALGAAYATVSFDYLFVVEIGQ